MADIRVARRGGMRGWHWLVIALIVLVVALVLLYYAGYITLPTQLGVSEPQQSLGSIASLHLQEA